MVRSQPADTTAIPQFANGVQWARAGVEHVRKDTARWLGMSALYLILAVLLSTLPFAGPLLLVLLSPMLLAGALLTAERPEAVTSQTVAERWAIVPGRELMRAIVGPTYVYPTVLLAIITLGLVVATFIIEYLVGGSSVGSLRNATALGAIPPVSLLVGLLVAGLLQALLLMALFYAVHRVVFARRDPLAAMEESFRACVRYWRPLTALTAIYLVPYLLVAGAFGIYRPLGYVALFTIGLVSLPTFVLATYRSYLEIFPVGTPG